MIENNNRRSITGRHYHWSIQQCGYKNILTNNAKQVGLICADFFDREKLMHTIPLNVRRHSDRAGVANRAIFATRKLLNSQAVQNTKSPFSNTRAGTAKLWAVHA